MEKRWLPGLLSIALILMALILTACSQQEEKITGSGVATAEVSTLTVTVKDDRGSLVPEARVYLNNEFKGETSKYGGSKGSQTMILEGQENKIQVRKAGYESSRPITVSASDDGEQSLTIILEKKQTNYVVSVRAAGEPLEQARVSLFPEGKSVPLQIEQTDQHGDALFQDLPDGEYIVTVAKEGYELLRTKHNVDFSEEGEFTSLSVELTPLAQLEVQVTDQQGSPLANAEVWLFTQKQYHAPGAALPLGKDYTNRRGKVSFTNVEYEETYIVVVKKEDYLAQAGEITLQPDDRVLRLEMIWDIN